MGYETGIVESSLISTMVYVDWKGFSRRYLCHLGYFSGFECPRPAVESLQKYTHVFMTCEAACEGNFVQFWSFVSNALIINIEIRVLCLLSCYFAVNEYVCVCVCKRALSLRHKVCLF